MAIRKAIRVAERLPFNEGVPVNFRIAAAADLFSIDRLEVVNRMREISTELGPSANPLNVAEILEKEIRAAMKED